MTNNTIKSVCGCSRLVAGVAVLLLVSFSAIAARAAEPIFPTGSRVGLIPPPGMSLSQTFPGFEDPNKKSVIFIGTLSADAYDDIQKSLGAEELKKQGITLEQRETLQLSFGKGILLVGTQLAADKVRYRKWLLLAAVDDFTVLVSVQVPQQDKAYPDTIVRAALATLALRDNVPEPELLSLLPFKIGDLAGFHVANVIPGRALLLIDAPTNPHMVATKGVPEYDFDGRLIVAALPGGVQDTENRADFARLAFGTIGGIKDVQFTMSEPVRIDNQEGFETVARAKDTRTESDLMVVQWLRFGNGAFLQIVGIARADIWPTELPRLRTMRDSIELK